jgi:hypothetical protein
MNKVDAVVVFCLLLFAATFSVAQAHSNNQPAHSSAQASGDVPVMDGGAGPCSLALTVLGEDGKPVYGATVKVHIAYGFAGVRKLDLQAGTNADGKVKFTGIPFRVHHPPLEFDAAKNALQGMLNYDPSAECDASHEIKLEKPKPQNQQ